MSPRDFTQTQLIGWGGEDVFSRAMAIGARMGVVEAHWDAAARVARGKIAQRNGWNMPTGFRLDERGHVLSDCPCRTHREQGMICEHVVALALLLMYRMNDAEAEEKYQRELRTAKRIASIDPALYVRRSPHGEPMRLSFHWNREVCDEFAAGRVNASLVFVDQAGRQYKPETLAGREVCISTAADELLGVLEDICEGPATGSITMGRADFLNVAALLTRQKPVKCSLRAVFNEATGEFTIRPHVDLPFERDEALDRYLVEGGCGMVWSVPRGREQDGVGMLTPLANVLREPFASVYARPEVITREAMPDFIASLPTLRRNVEVEMFPGEDMFCFVPAEPVIRLELFGVGGQTLGAELYADYDGGRSVRCGRRLADRICCPDPGDVLVYRTRNLKAEQDALKTLKECGLEYANEKADRLTSCDRRVVLNFLGGAMPALVRRRWKVNCNGALQEWVDSVRAVMPVVKIADVGGGDFEVGCAYDDGGRGVRPSEVQAALNREDAYLMHDGELFFVDADAVKEMRHTFEDCPTRPSPTPGRFILSGVYAAYVRSSMVALADWMDLDDDEAKDWREAAAAHDESAKWEPVDLGRLEGTLRPYQKQGVYWMRFLERSGMCGLLADEMGLGKTLQTLTWLSLERVDARARGLPALVVCPTSLVANWASEAAKFTPWLKCLVVSGPERAGCFDEIDKADIVVTSYALLQRDLEEAYLGRKFSVVVLDEAQHIKNRHTRNARAAKRIESCRKLVLTGTPVENSVADVWSIFDFLMPGYLGRYDDFKAKTQDAIEAGNEAGRDEQERLRRKLHPFILRRLKKTVAKDLPDKIERVVYCPLTPEQQEWYARLQTEAKSKIGDMVKAKGFERSRMEILALLMRLRQVSGHVALLREWRERHPEAYSKSPGEGGTAEPEGLSGKLDVFFELLDEAMDGGHRVLVFSQFVTMLTLLRREFEVRGIPYCYLDGSTKDRLGECARFNRDASIPVFLISLHAGGTGLNLTGADMVVHFDPWWNPAVEAQATDRAHRIGQKRTVYVVKMIAEGTVEERVLALQRRKQLVIDATVGTTDDQAMEKLTYDDIKSIIGL